MKALIKKDYPKILFALSALILLLRALCGFCWSDESFYYSVACRLLQGAVPFSEEWYPTQLSGIFLMPFVALYRLIVGSNDGILLTFRILYVLVTTGVSVIIYRVLQKETGRVCALFTALLFLFYTHLNIITFSYYALSLLGATVFALCLLCYLQKTEKGESAKRFLVLSGVSFAVLVLSMPLMAFAYFGSVFIALLFLFLPFVAPRYKKCREALRQILLYHFFGILIIAVPFFIWLFSRISVSTLIQSLPYVLNDEEHDEMTMYVAMRNCFQNLSETFGKTVYLCYFLIALSVLTGGLMLFLRNREHRNFKIIKVSALIADIAAFILLFIKCIGHTGYVQIALILFALPLFFMTEKKDLRLFFLFLLPGICLSYCYIYASSGASVYTEAIGFALASIGAPAMILSFAKELRFEQPADRKKNLLLYIPLYTLILSALILTITLRMINIYRDDSLLNLTEPIKDGPAAGIFTTKAHLKDYETVLDVLQTDCMLDSYRDDTHTKLLISKLLPWGYLSSDMHCASFSSWRSAMDSAQLQKYYELHPDSYPDVILLLDPHFGSYETCGDVEADPFPNENANEGFLFDYINAQGFIKKSVPCGTLFVRP
ncbi:MAG: hypothetical protein IJU25_07900 [Lachnospiraceae bacterium]|nr:hypothetical protein [Lachnospiraceae bacterium]